MNAAGERYFFDTNLLIYWLDPSDMAKHQAARKWVTAVWEGGRGATSWQVLNEFYVNATHKIGAPVKVARALVEAYSEWDPVGFGLPLLRRAWHWTDQASISYWDSLIVAAAESASCRYLLSEDLQHGRRFGAITVINPFQHAPEEFLS